MAEVHSLILKSDSTQIKNSAKDLDGLTNSAGGATKSLGYMKNAAIALAAAIGVDKIVGYADTWSLVNSRLKLATNSTNEFTTAQKELFKISQESRQSFEATADLYSRMSRSTRSLGTSQSDLLKVTETVNKALVVSGTSAGEAASVITQLGQGLASGVLRGDEFNSIMENGSRVSQAMADSLGVTIGQLRQMAQDGKLTSEIVINALLKQSDTINSEFGRMDKTVGQSSTQMQNSLMRLIGEMDNSTGASKGLADGISGLSGIFDSAANSIHNFNIEIQRLQDVRKIKNFDDANTALKQIDDEIKALTTSTSLWDRTKRTFDGQVQIQGKLNSLYAARASLNAKVNVMAEKENTVQEKLATTISLTSSEVKKLASAMEDINSKMSLINKNDFEKEIIAINDQASKYREAKVNESIIQEYVSKSKNEIRKKYEDKSNEESLDAVKKYNQDIAKLSFEADQEAQNAIKTYNEGVVSAQIDSYTALGRSSDAYYFQEEEKIRKLAETGWYTNEQLLAIKTADNDKFQKEQWEKDNIFWSDLFKNINKSMESQFFDAMTGKFKSWGNWFKDFWSSITNSLLSGLSKTLADNVMGGIQNVFKSSGGFSGLASMIFGGGTTASASQGTGITDSVSSVLSSSGMSSSVSSIASMASNLKTAFSLVSNGIEGTIAPYIESLGNFMQATSFNVGGLSGSLGGMALGGLGGYAIGSLGDMLLGTNTKAGSYGAIGGAIGSIAGPLGFAIGAGIGSIIGGMQGSDWISGQGYKIDSATSSNVTGKRWAQTTASDWSGKDVTNYFANLKESETTPIKTAIKTFEILLSSMNISGALTVSGGLYTSIKDFVNKGVSKAFIDAVTTADTNTVYKQWAAYAKSIKSTVSEALGASIGMYISGTRSFTEWNLGKGTTEQLKFTSDYLTKDFNALADSLGASGVTAENYLAKYDEAIKGSFTPETITSWKSLGDALMSATDASKAYADALATQVTYMPQDMMLRNIATSTNTIDLAQLAQNQNITNSQSLTSLYEIVKVLKQQLTLQQFGTQSGIPAA